MLNVFLFIVDSLSLIPNNDTLTVILPDTSNELLFSENHNKAFGEYSTVFWGIIGGSITAVIAAYLTNYFAKINQQKKDRRIYEGILYSIHTELHWHLSQTVAFEHQLSELKRVSMYQKQFVTDRAPNSYDVRYLEYCRQRLLEYDHFDHKIVAYLSTYINLLNETNVNVDFTSAKMLLSMNDENTVSKIIGEYFDHIESDNIKKIKITIPLIRNIIELELKNIPENLLVESERNKKVKK